MQTIAHIIDVKPYQIAAKFGNGEIRKIDFTSSVEKFPLLKEPADFAKAKIDEYPTIACNGLASIRALDGTTTSCALDCSAETLYQLSISQTN